MDILIKDETFSDYKSILSKYDNFKKTQQSSPQLSKYEKTSIIGIRAQQIAYGAKPLISVPEHITSTIEIAEEELKQRKTPFILERQIGNKIEYWKIEDLIF
jgi:DNA-directed RNA polymerase subunit K/omega